MDVLIAIVNSPYVVAIVGGLFVTWAYPRLAKLLDPGHPFWRKPFVGLSAGVAAALMLFVIWIVVQGTGHHAPHPSASTPAPVVLPSSPATTAGPSPTSRTLAAHARPWWQGQITITDPGIQLDAKPPSENQGNCTLSLVAGYLHPCGNGLLATWKGPSAPTAARCRGLAQSNGAIQLQATSGMRFCLLTDMGRPAYVKITSVSPDGSAAQAKVIVWNS